MKFKDVNLGVTNLGFMKILDGNIDRFLIDANMFIPPDRSKEFAGRVGPINFNFFRENWIEPFIKTFKPIGIHEAVLNEFESNRLRSLISVKEREDPPSIIIYSDSSLSYEEKIYRDTIESRISVYTNYHPEIDNRTDRGEVKSLAYIATKNLIYFCSHDSNAIRLIEDSEKLNTNLSEVSAIKPYEIIYYFIRNNIGNKKNLKIIYRYMYHLSINDKRINPNWSDFIEGMDRLYCIND